MSGTFPTENFAALDWASNVTVRQTESLNGKTQRSHTGGQYWSFTLQSPPLDRSDFMSIYAFIVKQKGAFDSFTIQPPVISNTSGTISGNISTKNNSPNPAAVGDTTIVVNNTDDGSPATGSLKAGDIIKFANHDKVYMLVSDATLDGSSDVTLNIFPGLVETVANGQAVTYNDVPVKVHFVENKHSYSVGPDLLYSYEIEVREVI